MQITDNNCSPTLSFWKGLNGITELSKAALQLDADNQLEDNYLLLNCIVTLFCINKKKYKWISPIISSDS